MYSTGTATDVNDLLTKLRDFCEANGWTRDADGTEGLGRRWHSHRGSVYVNFRSFLNESPSVNVVNAGSGVYGIAFNVGTGYSGLASWYDQAGVPQGQTSLYVSAGITRASGAITSYHFFAHNSGDNIMCVIEYGAGLFQHFGFGTLTKFGTYTGGEYFFGSRTGVDNTPFGGNGLIPRVGFFDSEGNSSTTSPAFIRATVDAEAGWKWSVTSTSLDIPTGKRRVKDNLLNRYAHTLGIQPNTLNDLQVFMPVVAQVFRATTNNDSTDYRSPLGELPDVHFVKINNLVPKQQVTLGSTDYRIFPFYIKNNSADTPTAGGSTGHSSYWGFAVKE